VLDSMNCVMFADHKQAIMFKLIEMVDDCDMWNGSMEVMVCKLKARDIHLTLNNMIRLF
jgi:hypothetical protein